MGHACSSSRGLSAAHLLIPCALQIVSELRSRSSSACWDWLSDRVLKVGNWVPGMIHPVRDEGSAACPSGSRLHITARIRWPSHTDVYSMGPAAKDGVPLQGLNCPCLT